ncbi:MAG: arginase [Acidobacteria bacterium]|nr:arginase [Acidobacteriota bacterium]
MPETISILGAPLDLGAGRRGVDMGPSALRVANLNVRLQALGFQVVDEGNVPVEQAESARSGPDSARFLKPIAATCTELAARVEKAAARGRFPLVLGGDHSVAVGTVSGMARHFQKRRGKLGLIWLDAHTDMNTPATSPSGNVHGMPLACLIGQGPKALTHLCGFAPKVEPRNVALVGVRDVDISEKNVVWKSGVRVFTMRDIDERGMRAVIEDALQVACDGTAGVHLSLDMDGVDPAEAPGVGTPVRGGFSYREAHLAMEILCDSHKLCSMEVVEVNPVLDTANRTALLGVELVLSAMGKRIL